MISSFIGGFLIYKNANDGLEYPIIPRPLHVITNSGFFEVTSEFFISVDNSSEKLKETGDYLAEKLRYSMGREIEIKTIPTTFLNGTLQLELNLSEDKLGNEGYNLVINESIILITAQNPKGVFYGIQTLLQLFPPSIGKLNGLIKEDKILLPCLQIRDQPRFSYRGMHLDVARHFFPVSFIKKYLDLLALYKYNTFHWHLTDDQGWRVEIKNYSKLTEIGAYRMEGHGNIYGGYYTQDEIRDILEYAEKRYITIIPEIEMPGHCMAVLAAYPELSCTGGPYSVPTKWGIYEDVYCAGNDEVFEFLETVLLEVIELFPSKYIHIGGDECPKARWELCPKCQARIMNESLQNESELQSYFISQISTFLQAHNRSIIGWNEIIEGGLAENATVMAWNSWDAAIAAVRLNHTVIMTPTEHCYFDYYQGDPLTEPKAIGGYIPLSKVYSFEPIPAELNSEEAKYILGAQGNLWTEYIETPDHIEYMCVPRMSALAEVLWTEQSLKSWNHFKIRLFEHFRLLDSLEVNYSRSSLFYL